MRELLARGSAGTGTRGAYHPPSAYYSSETDESNDLTFREYLSKMSFEQQRQEGLRIMRNFGVLL